MKNAVAQIVNALTQFNPVVHESSSGSFYISFTGSKVREIRVSNHTGHKLKRNVWQVRSDAMSSRDPKNNNRVYNVNAINQLIKEFK